VTADNEIAEILNRIFELRIGWTTGIDSDNPSREDFQEFHDLCVRLVGLLRNAKLADAIWTLTQNQDFITVAMVEPSLMDSIGFTEKERQEVKKGVFEAHQILSDKFAGAPRARWHEDGGRTLMQLFYESERVVLQKAGLNQASVAIIIERLRRSEPTIVQHLLNRSSVYTGRFIKALGALQTFSHRVARFRGRKGRVAKPGKSLIPAKDKVVGLATLWGNALPLVLTKDWGIAGVISTTAGATVAAVLPSGERKRSPASSPKVTHGRRRKVR
jgi:hypothetical protein